jgi:hypothetical protein
MTVLYLAGDLFNIIGRGPTALTTSGTEDALFPLANVHSYRPSKPGAENAAGTDIIWTKDITQLEDPGFEAAGALETDFGPVWTIVNGSAASAERAIMVKRTGLASARLDPTAESGAVRVAHDTVSVRCGERLLLLAWMRQNGAGDGGGVQVKDVSTGKYLDSLGAWVADSTTLPGVRTTGDTSAAFVSASQTFAIEDSAAHNGAFVTEIEIACYIEDGGAYDNGSTVLYFDDIVLFPTVNFAAFIGHNIPGSITPLIQSGTAKTTRMTFDAANDGQPRQPSFYGYLETPINAAVWHLKFSGVSEEAMRMGEWVLGYAEELDTLVEPRWSTQYEQPQIRNITPAGHRYHSARGAASPLRSVEMPFVALSAADRAEILDEIIGRSAWGALPGVIVPDSSERDVMWGYFRNTLSMRRHHTILSQDTLAFDEDGHMDWIDG